MKGLYRILVVILIVLLSLPGLQYTSGIFKLKPLNGVINEPQIAPLTFTSYLNFEFQTSVLKYIDRHFGFRSFFIRLYNQVDYSFFNTSHGHGTIIGLNSYLYEKWYILDYLGYYYLGGPIIEEKIQKFSEIRYFLKQYNTELLILLTPGKGYYYPEYIPKHFQRKREQTNYGTFAELLKNSSVPVFDVNGWFVDLKDSLPYPLFTKTGTHWSEYGAKMTADSLIKLCEVLLHKKMNKVHISDVEWSTEPRHTDNDLEKLLNLYFPIKQDSMAYPIMKRDNSIPKKDRPSVIVIGDSFYWNIYDGTIGNSFLSNQYWYYYNSIFPQRGNPPLTVNDIDVVDAFAKTNIVILATSTAGLYKMGDGIIEDVWPTAKKYVEAKKNELLEGYSNNIRNSKKSMRLIREKAMQRGISIDSMIYLDANYLMEKELNRF